MAEVALLAFVFAAALLVVVMDQENFHRCPSRFIEGCEAWEL